jgi:hypothetical protein
MREIRMSGLMSGEGKRGLRHRLKNPRLSSLKPTMRGSNSVLSMTPSV